MEHRSFDETYRRFLLPAVVEMAARRRMRIKPYRFVCFCPASILPMPHKIRISNKSIR